MTIATMKNLTIVPVETDHLFWDMLGIKINYKPSIAGTGAWAIVIN